SRTEGQRSTANASSAVRNQCSRAVITQKKVQFGSTFTQPDGTCEASIGVWSLEPVTRRMQRSVSGSAPKSQVANREALYASPTQYVCSKAGQSTQVSSMQAMTVRRHIS